MIQDIGKGRYRNEYRPVPPKDDSYVLCYRENEILVKELSNGISFLTYGEVQKKYPRTSETYTYLFTIDDRVFYLLPDLVEMEFPETSWDTVFSLRQADPAELAFAGITGYQLFRWYRTRRFCPACGQRMVPSEKERMMYCKACGQMEYPKISPAVIVGVWNKDRLLLTRYAQSEYKKYALIAGFAEVGESIEDTVRREVMEETGLKVKNLCYYKSQPWSLSDTLLMGFWAELDGSGRVHLDDEELSEAKWCTREEIPEDDGISLTGEMMQVFKNDGIQYQES